MICKIADLFVEIPEAGGMAPRCQQYQTDENELPDIVIREDAIWRNMEHSVVDNDLITYLETGWQFYFNLLSYDGIYLHASAVEFNGKAYLFSGNSGAGKSTHTRLWQEVLGEKARVFNDDKPALRFVDGKWYAYGTPWCGKDGININMKVPVGGICFLVQSLENRIRRLDRQEAVQRILSQTLRRFGRIEKLELMLKQVDKLVCNIPVFELENRPEADAVRLSYETMYHAAREEGL